MNAPDFYSLCEYIPQQTSVEGVWSLATEYYAGLGIDGLLYADLKPQKLTLMTNLSQDWTTHYTDQDYVKVDPFFRYCCNSYAASDVGQDCIPHHSYMTPAEKRFILDAGETGLTAGFVSPLRAKSQNGLAGWNFLSSYGRAHVNNLRHRHENEMRLIGHMVHQQISQVNLSEADDTTQLTSRETEALQWTARGLRTDMIAAKMNLRPVTVELHLRNARTKLSAKTRDQAVAIALVAGRISL